MENNSQGVDMVTCVTLSFRILWTSDYFVPPISPSLNAVICYGSPGIASSSNVVSMRIDDLFTSFPGFQT